MKGHEDSFLCFFQTFGHGVLASCGFYDFSPLILLTLFDNNEDHQALITWETFI